MTLAENKNAPKEALNELTSILKKPYQDACNVCKGAGKITDSSVCPKCKCKQWAEVAQASIKPAKLKNS
jgi:DnaJ-class molecular chaperone